MSGPSTQHQAVGFYLHDNAPVHQAVDVQELLARKQVYVLHQPPYSPNLSPCDYFLFLKLKLPLKGRLFEDVQDIQAAVTSSLRAIPQEDVQRSCCVVPPECLEYLPHGINCKVRLYYAIREHCLHCVMQNGRAIKFFCRIRGSYSSLFRVVQLFSAARTAGYFVGGRHEWASCSV